MCVGVGILEEHWGMCVGVGILEFEHSGTTCMIAVILMILVTRVFKLKLQVKVKQY